MPVESPPEAGALWLTNWILSSTIADYTAQAALYPVKNLLTPHRSETWRSDNATDDHYVIFDLGSAMLPTCLALTDVNFDGGTYIRLRGSTDSAQVSGVVYWDLPLYSQDSVSKILRWYLGTPTSGSAAAKQYWGVRILPASFGSYNTDEDFFEIGSVFLGEYTNITPDQGVRISAKDPSDRMKAYGRAQWADPIRSYHQIDLTLDGLTFSELYTLKKLIVAQGSSHAILDVHAYSSDAVVKAGGCFYGYFDESPTSGRLSSPTNNELTLSFEEASG